MWFVLALERLWLRANTEFWTIFSIHMVLETSISFWSLSANINPISTIATHIYQDAIFKRKKSKRCLFAIGLFTMENEARLFCLAVTGFNRHSIKSEGLKDAMVQLEINKSVKGFQGFKAMSRIHKFFCVSIFHNHSRNMKFQKSIAYIHKPGVCQNLNILTVSFIIWQWSEIQHFAK